MMIHFHQMRTVIDNEKLRGYDAEEYPFMEEIPPYSKGYVYVGPN